MYTDRDLQRQIDETAARGGDRLTVTGEYEIRDTVLLPAHFTLILEDCVLRQADGSAAQIFRNAGYRQGESNFPADADEGIRIIGRGKAVLDGGKYNGLSERNSGKDGRPHIWQNCLILFSNVVDFELKGLQIRNQRWWALCFLFCRNGHISDIDFCADDTYTDGDGVLHHGLVQDNYEGVTVKNADGIDLRAGCSDILIENLTGFCEDDMVALTDLDGSIERAFSVEGAPTGIENVEIRNVNACSYCSIVRLLNQRPGAVMRNIHIHGIFDTSKDSPHIDRGIYAVRVGDTRLYGDAPLSEEAVNNIRIENVRARSVYAVGLAGKMSGVTVNDIEIFDGAREIEDKRG